MQGQTGQGAGSHKGAGGPQGIQWQTTQMTSSPTWHLLQMWEGENITRHRTARLWTLLAEGVAKKGHYEKGLPTGQNTLHTLWRHHRWLQQALGPVNLYITTMRDNQFTLTWLVSPHANKHLIRFPIMIEPMSLRRKGHTHGFFSSYTFCIAQGRYSSRCQPDQQEDFRSTLWQQSVEAYTHQDGELWKIRQSKC